MISSILYHYPITALEVTMQLICELHGCTIANPQKGPH